MTHTKLSHVHPSTNAREDTSTETSSRVRNPLPESIPPLPILIRAGGRIFSLSEKAVRTYCDEYGLTDEFPFDFNDCINHIVLELEEAFLSTPIPVSRRTPAVRIQSRNLVFTLIGSAIMSIRISLKYSSRGRAKQQEAVE